MEMNSVYWIAIIFLELTLLKSAKLIITLELNVLVSCTCMIYIIDYFFRVQKMFYMYNITIENNTCIFVQIYILYVFM